MMDFHSKKNIYIYTVHAYCIIHVYKLNRDVSQHAATCCEDWSRFRLAVGIPMGRAVQNDALKVLPRLPKVAIDELAAVYVGPEQLQERDGRCIVFKIKYAVRNKIHIFSFINQRHLISKINISCKNILL